MKKFRQFNLGDYLQDWAVRQDRQFRSVEEEFDSEDIEVDRESRLERENSSLRKYGIQNDANEPDDEAETEESGESERKAEPISAEGIYWNNPFSDKRQEIDVREKGGKTELWVRDVNGGDGWRKMEPREAEYFGSAQEDRQLYQALGISQNDKLDKEEKAAQDEQRKALRDVAERNAKEQLRDAERKNSEADAATKPIKQEAVMENDNSAQNPEDDLAKRQVADAEKDAAESTERAAQIATSSTEEPEPAEEDNSESPDEMLAKAAELREEADRLDAEAFDLLDSMGVSPADASEYTAIWDIINEAEKLRKDAASLESVAGAMLDRTGQIEEKKAKEDEQSDIDVEQEEMIAQDSYSKAETAKRISESIKEK